MNENTVGEILKENRLLKNKSIQEVCLELKISSDIIKKFENDEIILDNDVVFYIGHLRSYCILLELDVKLMTNKFKKQISFEKNEIIEKISKPTLGNNIFNLKKFYPVSLILIIFTSFYFLFINDSKNSQQFALIPDLPENYIPIIEKANLNKFEKKNDNINSKSSNYDAFNPTSAVASNKNIKIKTNDTITLKLLNPTWLQLRDKSNNIIFSKLMEKDDEFTYDMNLEYNITAGNAGNILVTINTDVVGKLGEYGEIVDSLILDNSFNN